VFFNQHSLTAEQFLRDYWQKQPLLLPRAFPDFVPELDANDIAGLACDELAESRLITGRYPDHDWSVRYGPFSDADFAALPERDWTLLVQDVEKHYPPLQDLLAAFAFLPRWRIDDLMVSVAGPGGSVGPHVDQYDVFLLQAAGSRRWEIAESCTSGLLPDCELNVLQSFEAQQAWVLQPGDMLYLPPGVAHHGIALGQDNDAPAVDSAGTPCMTWSVGMRAPSTADLLQALGEWLAESDDQGGRYRDASLEPARRAGEIDPAALNRARELVRSASDDTERFAEFLGSFVSRFRLAHEPAAPARTVKPDTLQKALNQGGTLHHNPWTRLTWIERPGGGALLFAAGATYPCTVELATTLCDPRSLQSASPELGRAAPDLLCELINRGHLVVESL
jgi:50S ribosomal protein L16 3-hydroxylase